MKDKEARKELHELKSRHDSLRKNVWDLPSTGDLRRACDLVLGKLKVVSVNSWGEPLTKRSDNDGLDKRLTRIERLLKELEWRIRHCEEVRK